MSAAYSVLRGVETQCAGGCHTRSSLPAGMGSSSRWYGFGEVIYIQSAPIPTGRPWLGSIYPCRPQCLGLLLSGSRPSYPSRESSVISLTIVLCMALVQSVQYAAASEARPAGIWVLPLMRWKGEREIQIGRMRGVADVRVDVSTLHRFKIN
ncbi:hypothetical protein BDN70DRAFT_454671 [Pholiota conissans]|uniref:Uncharacterized protein n=1 Tax=Pholiota conissans TaxID=109636 RepID=A0A9P6CTY1_9AGAR|nr:hypothetical protein BDN70DRAFT_454671 [Pholiota conissans]